MNQRMDSPRLKETPKLKETQNKVISNPLLRDKDIENRILKTVALGGIGTKLMDKHLCGDYLKELDGMAKRNAFNLAERVISKAILKEFDHNSKKMQHCNDDTMKSMLMKNKDTEFGKEHNFSKILSSKNPINEYKQNVPLSDYWDYEKAINKMAAGQKNILTAETPDYFALSSGTTGKNKLIPINKSATFQSFKCAMLIEGMAAKLIPGANSSNRGLNLMRMSDDIHKTPGGIPMGDASSGGIKKMSWMLPLLYTTPERALTIADKPTANFVHLVFGLKEAKLKHITSTFVPYVVQLLKNMEQRWPDLVRTLETGKLPKDLVLTPSQKADIELLIRPDPNRAHQLSSEFSKGFDNIIPRIWPDFKYIGTVTTGSFEVYVPQLKQYSGNTPVFNGTYAASEGWMGIGVSLDKPKDYALIPGANYYEFIPLENINDKNPKTVEIKDIKPGKEYEMVLSTHGGFYRYRMGDIVKVNGFYEENPVIEFSFRTGTLLNLAAEKVTEKQTADAVKNFADKFLNKGDKLIDYTAIADTSINPPRYRFFIELKTDKPLNDVTVHRNAVHLLEEEMGKSNYDYEDMRNKRMLSEMDVCFVKPGAFERLADTMRKAGEVKLANQIKIPRVLKNKSLIAQLDKEIIK